MDLSLGALAFAAVAVAILVTRELSKTKVSRDEYKELFEASDLEYKRTQEKIQELLIADTNKTILVKDASKSLGVASEQIISQADFIKVLQEKLDFQEAQYKKLFGQKKSSEVRTGKIAEQIAPFLENYPKDAHTARFIGDPIDFVHFDEDAVTFVEVKSGKSQLSKKQRHIRDLIAAGKVDFTIYRVKGESPLRKDDDDGDNGTS